MPPPMFVCFLIVAMKPSSTALTASCDRSATEIIAELRCWTSLGAR